MRHFLSPLSPPHVGMHRLANLCFRVLKNDHDQIVALQAKGFCHPTLNELVNDQRAIYVPVPRNPPRLRFHLPPI